MLPLIPLSSLRYGPGSEADGDCAERISFLLN